MNIVLDVLWLITQLISVKIVIKPVKFSLKSLLSWTWRDRMDHRMGAIFAARGLSADNAELTWPSCTQQVFWQLHWWPNWRVWKRIFQLSPNRKSYTCNKKAIHIPVSILIISRLNSHNLSTNWVVTAEDVLSVVRFAGSACGHFPVYASNMKPSVWWNNEVKSSEP